MVQTQAQGGGRTHPVEVGLLGDELFNVRVRPVRVHAVHHLLLGLERLQKRLAVGALLNQLGNRRVWPTEDKHSTAAQPERHIATAGPL